MESKISPNTAYQKQQVRINHLSLDHLHLLRMRDKVLIKLVMVELFTIYAQSLMNIMSVTVVILIE